jgi:hypothetical protein
MLITRRIVIEETYRTDVSDPKVAVAMLKHGNTTDGSAKRVYAPITSIVVQRGHWKCSSK